MERIRIRRAERRDIPAVLEIEREGFSNPWPARHFLAELSFPFSFFYVAEAETSRELAGFIIFWLLGSTAELHNIAVRKTRQRQGIAAKMVEYMLAMLPGRAAEVFLEVRESNIGAIRLYEKFGFQQWGRRKDYYQHPDEDALVFRKAIKRSPASP